MSKVLTDAALASAPARKLKLVTKADTDQATPLTALRICVAEGDAPVTLKITPLDGASPGDDITLTYPVAGVYWEPMGAKRVWSTGSTGTVIIHGAPGA